MIEDDFPFPQVRYASSLEGMYTNFTFVLSLGPTLPSQRFASRPSLTSGWPADRKRHQADPRDFLFDKGNDGGRIFGSHDHNMVT